MTPATATSLFMMTSSGDLLGAASTATIAHFFGACTEASLNRSNAPRFGWPSQPHLAGDDASIEHRVEAHETLCGRIVEVDRIADHARVEALLGQVDLLRLEGRGQFDVVADAQEEGSCIVGQ